MLMDKIMLMVGTKPVIIKMVPVLRVLQAKSIHAHADNIYGKAWKTFIPSLHHFSDNYSEGT